VLEAFAENNNSNPEMKEIDIGQERDLEALVLKDPDAVEPGLRVLTHQRRANGKFIDVLCADKENVLVVMELKIVGDDEMLFQALEYYDFVSANRDRLANEYQSKAKIIVEEDPRIILVAPNFGERLRKAARFFTVEIDLRQYSYLESKGGEGELYCKDIAIVTEGEYTPPVSRNTVLAYVNSPVLQKLCSKVHEEILHIGKDLEEAPMSWRTEIRYKCKNRIVGWLIVRKTFFYIGWKIDEKRWHEIEITSARDWATKKSQVLSKLEKRYREFGGE
jgi:hypothetical protein